MAKKKSEHYVNNKELLEAMIVYRTKVEASYKKFYNKDLTEQPKEERAKRWETKPPIPNYLGECFLKIATHLSYKPNFVNYMFREDMISDGIENCVQYIHNFDPAKSKNPFAYFTQIIYFAFLRRIQKEKKYLYTKYKASENTNLFGETSENSGENGRNYNEKIKYNEWSEEYMNDFIENFEENKRRKKRKTVAPLDKFMAE